MSDAPLKTSIVQVTIARQNCSLLICPETGKAAIIDPGGDVDLIRKKVAEENIDVEKILLTHGHLDHAGGAPALARLLSVPIEGPHRDEAFLLDALGEQSQIAGFSPSEPCTPDRWLEDDDEIRFGATRLRVRHCPGHTPGHVAYYHAGTKLAWVGDILFRGSIGRFDIPRGNYGQLVKSITERLWPLGNETHFVPGHGPISSFGWERETNPFGFCRKLFLKPPSGSAGRSRRRQLVIRHDRLHLMMRRPHAGLIGVHACAGNRRDNDHRADDFTGHAEIHFVRRIRTSEIAHAFLPFRSDSNVSSAHSFQREQSAANSRHLHGGYERIK